MLPATLTAGACALASLWLRHEMRRAPSVNYGFIDVEGSQPDIWPLIAAPDPPVGAA